MDNSFRSGTSQMILMVTSPWNHRLLRPRGLVSILLGLLSQFRGDWSQWMTSFSSESDSNTFTGEVMQCHLLYYIFSVSLQRWIPSLRIHECLEWNQAGLKILILSLIPGYRCVSIIIFFGLSVNSLSSLVNVDSVWRWPKSNVGVHSCISITKSRLKRASVLSSKNRNIFYMKRWLGYITAVSDSCCFCIRWICNNARTEL